MSNKELYDNIFIVGNEINYPKNLNKKCYAIMYPTDGFYLKKEQHEVIWKSLNELGFINEVFGIDIEFLDVKKNKSNDVRKLFKFDFADYRKDLLLFENCIYDSEFKWSVSVFQDYWAIIYGEKVLIDKISLNYDLKSDLDDFFDQIIDEIKHEKTKASLINFVNNSHISKKR